MPNPEDKVLKHSGGLWQAAKDGIIKSEDLSPSLRLKISDNKEHTGLLQKKSNLTCKNLRANLPFAIQRQPIQLCQTLK